MLPAKRHRCVNCNMMTEKWQRVNGGHYHCYDGCRSTTGYDHRLTNFNFDLKLTEHTEELDMTTDTTVNIIDFDGLINALHDGEATVTFRKADGTERRMRCTLNEKYLPLLETRNTTARVPNPNLINVWDLEKAGWRSFRRDSVISVE